MRGHEAGEVLAVGEATAVYHWKTFVERKVFEEEDERFLYGGRRTPREGRHH